jgi:hypothetical protein
MFATGENRRNLRREKFAFAGFASWRETYPATVSRRPVIPQRHGADFAATKTK